MRTSEITRPHRPTDRTAVKPAEDHGRQASRTAPDHPLALDQGRCHARIDSLNQLRADTITLRDMYQEHDGQASKPTVGPLHLLLDQHLEVQTELVDQIAERIQMLGGARVPMALDAADGPSAPPTPQAREDASTQISRLLQAHEVILEESSAMAREASEHGDDATHDMIVSDIIRANEMQVLFLFMHVTQEHL